MPSLIDSTVTANYLKAKPSTRFGTRDLAFMVIDADNGTYYNNFLDSNSNFSKTIRVVQTQAEIYAVGEPNGGYLTIVVAIDTTNDGENTDDGMNEKAQTIRQALLNAGLLADSVSFKRLYGNTFASQDMSGYNPNGQTYVG
jgi:hypothetical protein